MRRKKILFRISAILLAVAAIAVIASSQARYYRSVKDAQYIYPGISICGVDVGMLSVEDAIKKVDGQAGDIVLSPVTIKWQQHQYELSQLKLREFAIKEMAERAYTYGRMGGNFERWLSLILLPAAKHDLTPDMGGEWPGLSDYLTEAAAEFEVAAKDAKIEEIDMNAQPGSRIRIALDSSGYELDIKKTARNVAAAVCAGLTSADAIMYEQAAGMTYDYIKQLDIDPVTASFAFEGQEAGAYAASMLSGGKFLLMEPGQLLSVRDFIDYNSSYSSDAYYNLAALHVASLIFNCSVQAGLAIPEHSGTDTMPRMLYAPGTEAVVNDSEDLTVRNMLSSPVIISVNGEWQGGMFKLTCSIFRTQMYYSAALKSFCNTADQGAYSQIFRVWVNPDGTEAGRELIDEITYR